jgi:hypothetical protein
MKRRDLLKGMALGAAATLLPRGGARAQHNPVNPADRKFLIVVTGTGGASMVDFTTAVRASESNDPANLNVYPDGMVQSIEGSPFRAIDQELRDLGPLPYRGSVNQSDFVRRHMHDMMVVPITGTSVNHQVAEKRSLTGNEAWGGRTLQEAVAAAYGGDMPLANVNMGSGGFVEPGIDTTLPDFARHEAVADPRLWWLGLDGAKGVPGAPAKSLVEIARRTRNLKLDPESTFSRTFDASPALRRWRQQRGVSLPALERRNLIQALNILPNSATVPLNEFGLASAADAQRLREVFPLYFSDPLESQAALAYLLIKNGVSNTVTIGPNFSPLVGGQQIVDSPPLAFDFSHTAHRGAQALMWHRLLTVIDRLIGLLKETEYVSGGSYWDRSMVYVATDFGRSKRRPPNAREFGTAHDINNGLLVISPMVNGNTVLGQVDPNTLVHTGYNPTTGAPEPGRQMSEPELYAGLLQALGINTPNLPDMRAMRSS